MEQLSKQTHLPSFLTLAKESITLYGQKWQPLLKIVCASYVAYAIVTVFVLFILLLTEKTFPILIHSRLAWIAAIAFLSVIFILSSWFSAATIIVLRDLKDNIGLRESLRRAKPYVMPYFLISFLTTLFVFAGFIFFIIPGILFLIFFLFSGYIIFFEQERGIDALIKSKDYVRGFYWDIFILLLSLLATLIFVNYIFQIIGQLPFGKLFRSAANAAISPLTAIYLYLIFNHLRKIRGDSLPVMKAKKSSYIIFPAVLFIAIIVIAGLFIYHMPQIKNYYDLEIKKIETQSGIQLIKAK